MSASAIRMSSSLSAEILSSPSHSAKSSPEYSYSAPSPQPASATTGAQQVPIPRACRAAWKSHACACAAADAAVGGAPAEGGG